MNKSKKINCKLCKSLFEKEKIVISDWFNSSKTHSYLLCSNCKSLEIENNINNQDYNDSAQNFAREKGSFLINLIKSTISYTHKINFNKIIKSSKKNRKNGKLLEIGCGRGNLLKLAEKEGWIVTGIEPQKNKFAEAKNNINGKIYNSTFENINFDQKFDIIVLWHVFEHLENLDSLFLNIKEILAEDGEIFISVPNIKSFQYRLFSRDWFHLCSPAHNYQFSKEGLFSFVKKFDMIGYKVNHFDIIVSMTGWFFSFQNLFIKPNNYFWHFIQKTTDLGNNNKIINFVKIVIFTPIFVLLTFIGSLIELLFGSRANLSIIVKNN